MSVNKMSETIKSVLAATDTVLERPATRGEVIKVIELIESFKTSSHNETPAPTPAPRAIAVDEIVKAVNAVKATHKKPMRAATHIRWKQHKVWLDAILDGQTHVVPYSDLESLIPFKKFGHDNMRTRMYREAIKRGYKTATISFDNKSKAMLIQAIAK